eukprot:30896-Pelagococcus_subviridis.AAC.1
MPSQNTREIRPRVVYFCSATRAARAAASAKSPPNARPRRPPSATAVVAVVAATLSARQRTRARGRDARGGGARDDARADARPLACDCDR